MKYNKAFLVAILLLLLSSCSGTNSDKVTNTEKENNQAQEEPQDKGENIIRSTNFEVKKPYIIDRNRLKYKTDEHGNFKGEYIYHNETDDTDDINISVIYEGKLKPIKTYQIAVPGHSSKKVDIDLKNVPSSDQLVYILTQTSKFDLNAEKDLKWNRNADYVAPYYFNLKSNSTKAAIKNEDNNELIKPIHTKKVSEEDKEGRLIYLSDKEGNRIEKVDQENMYISLVNAEEFKLKGYLYNFQGDHYKNFKINKSNKDSFLYEIDPQTIQTFKLELEDFSHSYVRFISTASYPKNAYKDSPFTPRKIMYSGLYVFK